MAGADLACESEERCPMPLGRVYGSAEFAAGGGLAGPCVEARLSRKALLQMHGEDDEVLPPERPADICGHGLDLCRESIDRDLLAWTRERAASGQLVQPGH